MKISKAQIRRVIGQYARRGATMRQWSEAAVNRALDDSRCAESEAEKMLLRAIDTAAYAMRWAEFTGRFNCGLVFEGKFSTHRGMLEAMVRLYFRGVASVEMQKDAYRSFCELATQHAAEAAQ